MAMECDPAAVPDEMLPDDVYLNRLNLNGNMVDGSTQKHRTLDVAILDRKIHAALKKKSSRTPEKIRSFIHMKAVFNRISKAPHHPLHAELQDAVEKKGGLENFMARVIDHPELLETVPYLPRKAGVPHMVNHPDFLGTLPYVLDRKKGGTPPNSELLETILNYIAKRQQGTAG